MRFIVRRLFALDVRRLAARVRRPTLGDLVLLLLPLILLVAGGSAARGALAPDLSTRGGAGALGMLLGAPIAFLVYGVLFRAPDSAFLRKLGVPPRALYVERSGRLLGIALGLALVPILLAVVAGQPALPVIAVSLVAVMIAWGTAAASATLAARALTRQRPGEGWGCLTIGMWDGEIAKVAPLVYAPLVPLLAGSAAGAIAWGAGPMVIGALLGFSLAVAAFAARWWEQALPRFGAQVLEMAFEPPPPGASGQLQVGRGLARLLPRPAAAVWARDAVVAGRRFAWATRIVWPVAVLSLALLARWGGEPATRGWVAAAVVTVWLLQMGAMIGLGRYERATRRWFDRALGITPMQRLLGRWAWGWGASLYLGIPIALAWGWWAGAGPGWPWLLIGAGTAALGALASVASAGWGR